MPPGSESEEGCRMRKAVWPSLCLALVIALWTSCAWALERQLAGWRRGILSRQPVVEMGPGQFALKVITEAGCERVVRFAFVLARRRRGRRPTGDGSPPADRLSGQSQRARDFAAVALGRRASARR